MVERHHVVDVALHDPLEAVADAEHLDALEDGADGGRADDAVDAGRRAAADEDRQPVVGVHGTPSLHVATAAASRGTPSSLAEPRRGGRQGEGRTPHREVAGGGWRNGAARSAGHGVGSGRRLWTGPRTATHRVRAAANPAVRAARAGWRARRPGRRGPCHCPTRASSGAGPRPWDSCAGTPTAPPA